MAEEEKTTEAAAILPNGSQTSEDMVESAVKTKEEDKDGLKTTEEDIEKDGKAEVVNMDDGDNLNEGEETKSKEGKENTETIKPVEENGDGVVKMDEGEESKNKEEKESTETMKLEERKIEIVEEKIEDSKEKEVAEENVEGKRTRKHGKGSSAVEKGEAKRKEVGEKKAKDPSTPAFSVDRPVRERKSVERLVAVIEKDPAKEFLIGKGCGTALKDIPNVAYKLSRKKTDETFKMLHVILFGRRGKAFQVKYNVSQFSGFVWHENEEKQRLRVKEKFDKCVKEKLLEFCDVLDIPVAKTTAKKEDIVTKLLDFLAAPHATTDVLLAEKEKSGTARKRKSIPKTSNPTSGGTTAKRSARKRRKTEEIPKVMEKKSASKSEDESEKEEDEERYAHDLSEEEVAEHFESEENEDDSKEESEEEAGPQKQYVTSSPKEESSGKTRLEKVAKTNKVTPVRSTKKSPAKSSSKQSKVVDGNDANPKVFTRKKKNEETAKKKSSTPKHAPTEKASKEKSGKKVTEGKDRRKKVASAPTEEELREKICEILNEVDFNSATFTDILQQLGQKFEMDLKPRRSAIKIMIQEELTKLAEDDDEDSEGDKEKEEGEEPAGQEVGA